METFKIIFYRENDKETDSSGNIVSDVVEFMAANEISAMRLFEQAEPFAVVIRIEQI